MTGNAEMWQLYDAETVARAIVTAFSFGGETTSDWAAADEFLDSSLVVVTGLNRWQAYGLRADSGMARVRYTAISYLHDNHACEAKGFDADDPGRLSVVQHAIHAVGVYAGGGEARVGVARWAGDAITDYRRYETEPHLQLLSQLAVANRVAEPISASLLAGDCG